MKSQLPDLKAKIEENLKELTFGDNISELLCVLKNNKNGKEYQVSLTIQEVDDEDDFCDLFDVTEDTPVISIDNGSLIL